MAEETIPVWDENERNLMQIPAEDAHYFERDGYQLGEAATLAAHRNGWQGTVAELGMAGLRGLTLGASDAALARLAPHLQGTFAEDLLHGAGFSHEDLASKEAFGHASDDLGEHQRIASFAGEVAGSIPMFEAAGSKAAIGVLARIGRGVETAAVARKAALAAAGARTSVAALGGATQYLADADRFDTPIAGERLLMSAGLGGLMGVGGEAVGAVLPKIFSGTQKKVTELLDRAAMDPDRFTGVRGTEHGFDDQYPNMSHEAKQAFAGQFRNFTPQNVAEVRTARKYGWDGNSVEGAKKFLEDKKVMDFSEGFEQYKPDKATTLQQIKSGEFKGMVGNDGLPVTIHTPEEVADYVSRAGAEANKAEAASKAATEAHLAHKMNVAPEAVADELRKMGDAMGEHHDAIRNALQESMDIHTEVQGQKEEFDKTFPDRAAAHREAETARTRSKYLEEIYKVAEDQGAALDAARKHVEPAAAGEAIPPPSLDPLPSPYEPRPFTPPDAPEMPARPGSVPIPGAYDGPSPRRAAMEAEKAFGAAPRLDEPGRIEPDFSGVPPVPERPVPGVLDKVPLPPEIPTISHTVTQTSTPAETLARDKEGVFQELFPERKFTKKTKEEKLANYKRNKKAHRLMRIGKLYVARQVKKGNLIMDPAAQQAAIDAGTHVRIPLKWQSAYGDIVVPKHFEEKYGTKHLYQSQRVPMEGKVEVGKVTPGESTTVTATKIDTEAVEAAQKVAAKAQAAAQKTLDKANAAAEKTYKAAVKEAERARLEAHGKAAKANTEAKRAHTKAQAEATKEHEVRKSEASAEARESAAEAKKAAEAARKEAQEAQAKVEKDYAAAVKEAEKAHKTSLAEAEKAHKETEKANVEAHKATTKEIADRNAAKLAAHRKDTAAYEAAHADKVKRWQNLQAAWNKETHAKFKAIRQDPAAELHPDDISDLTMLASQKRGPLAGLPEIPNLEALGPKETNEFLEYIEHHPETPEGFRPHDILAEAMAEHVQPKFIPDDPNRKFIRPYGEYKMRKPHIVTKTIVTSVMKMLPYVGHTLAAAYTAKAVKDVVGRYALQAAFHHEQAINNLLGKMLKPGAQAVYKGVRMAIQTGGQSNKSFAYKYHLSELAGNYNKATQGINQFAQNPQAVNDALHKSLAFAARYQSGLIAQTATPVAKSFMYLQSQIPPSPGQQGALDSPMQIVPRSQMREFMQKYEAVNSPSDAFVSPTTGGMEAMAAVYPQTLTEVRQQLMRDLSDPKVAARVRRNPDLARRLSLILGIPLRRADTGDFIASAQAAAQAAGQSPPAPGAPGMAKPQSNGTVSLTGANAKNFVSSVAMPAQTRDLDNLGG